MLAKRIIPCLDVRNGKVVKGVNFTGIKEVDNPVELAKFYNKSGADELVFYDITASVEERGLFTDILKEVASQIFIPLTVGGGINTLDDFDRVLKAGADKVSVNSGAIRNPKLIEEAAKKYGDQCVVLSVDVKRVDGKFKVFAKGGRENTGIDAIEWFVNGQENGAGEVVVNSIDTDGVKNGFDLELLEILSKKLSIPIVASGGAGNMEHFRDLFKIPGIDAGLAASIFHFKEVEIMKLKKYLKSNGVEMRIWHLMRKIKILKNQEFEEKFLENTFLVVSATDNKELNDKISKLCMSKNILVNNITSQDNMNLRFMSILSNDDIQISITANGNPKKAVEVKNKIKEFFGKIF